MQNGLNGTPEQAARQRKKPRFAKRNGASCNLLLTKALRGTMRFLKYSYTKTSDESLLPDCSSRQAGRHNASRWPRAGVFTAKTRFWPIPTGKRLQSRGAQTRRFRDMTKLQKVRKRVAAKPGETGDFHQSSPNKGDFIGNRRTVTNRRGHASPSKAAAATPSRHAGLPHTRGTTPPGGQAPCAQQRM